MNIRTIFLTVVLLPFVTSAANAWMQEARRTPAWFTEGVMYQIQPRAFTPEGTLKAAEKKLPYLKDLGVTIAYLVPVMKMDTSTDRSFWSPRQIRSGFNNPKNQYRIADYFHVDEEYGTDQDLKDFCASAHRLGLKVLFDLVYLHCGPTAPFLKEHPDFTWWNKDGTVKKGPWRFPKLNFANPEVRKYFDANVRCLLNEFGADGFRCDVGDGIPLDFWCDLHDTMDAVTAGHAVLLCEGYTVCNQYKGFDADYGWFPGLSAVNVRRAWVGREKECPRGAKFVNHYENHDIATDARPRRELAWGHAQVDQVLVWMFTLDGVPMLFTGNELADADTRHSMFGKTPMDWTQLDREPGKSRHALVKRLAELRREHPSFTAVNGIDGLTWLDTTAPDRVSAFVRRGKGETVLVVQNWTAKEATCEISFQAPKSSVPSYIVAEDVDRDVKGSIADTPLLSRAARRTGERGFALGPWGFVVVQVGLADSALAPADDAVISKRAGEPTAPEKYRRPADWKPVPPYPKTLKEIARDHSAETMARAKAQMEKVNAVNRSGKYAATGAGMDRHTCPEWFVDAKLGMFVDWGLYSIAAYSPYQKGARLYPDWYEYKCRPEYGGKDSAAGYHRKNWGADFKPDHFIGLFRGDKFDAAKMMKVFRQCGAKYVVPFLKHHSGFCEWDCSYTFRDTVNSPAKRDFAREMADAARAEGLKFGVYNSQADEWEYPILQDDGSIKMKLWGGKVVDWTPDMETKASGKIAVKDFVYDYIVPQMTEFIDKYDPDLLWYDADWMTRASENGSYDITAYLYNRAEGRKEVCCNDRYGRLDPTEEAAIRRKGVKVIGCRTVRGDFFTDEWGDTAENIDPAKWHPWESCSGISKAYGNHWMEELDPSMVMSDKEFICHFTSIVARGGNLLLLVNLDGQGAIPKVQEDRMLSIGKWLEKNGEAIYGTRIVAPYSTTDVDYTRSKDGKTVYAIVKNPSAEVTLACALPAEAQVTELVSGRELAVVRDGTTVRVRVPGDLVSAKLPFVLKMKRPSVTSAPEWSVGEVNGAPGLLRKGRPVAPVLFWQWELEERDVRDLSAAGLGLFSCFGSFPHYAHPYWTPRGFGGMDYQDALLDKLLTWNPQASFLPRLFYSAPNWWIKSHPDELVRYTNPNVLAAVDAERNHAGALPRESFASERFRAEAGPVYRQAVRHLMDRYGDHLMGIHLTSGPWGEHFAWDALTQLGGTPLAKAGLSDASRPMTERFRRYLRTKYGADLARLRDAWKDGDVTFETAEVPSAEARNRLDADGVWRDPAKGRQVPDYFACMNLVTVEMLDAFAKIVKDESKGTLPTLAFYGYTQDEQWSLECDHRAIAAAYRSPNLDMFSAPHTYHRRSPGEDGVSRCYLASAALHGKLFIDEGDDMTHLEQLKPHPDFRCSATNMFESLNILYREFGMTVTHGTGLWYMDLKRDTFRHPELVAAVGRMRRAADEALRRDRSHRSEVAVVSNVESEFYMGYRRTEANNVSLLLYLQQLGAFYRAGAPFDWYLADDLDAVVRRGYRTVVFLDCQYLTDEQKAAVESLKSDGRTLVFFHAPGYVSPTGLSRERMESTCGVRMRPETVRGVLSAVDAKTGREWGCGLDRVIDGVEDRPRGVRHRKPGTAQKGLFLPAEGETLMTGVGNLKDVPVAVCVRHADWTGVFSALPALAPDVLRRLYRAAGVHVYTDADVVLSANRAWVMVHTRAAGDVVVRLPKKAARVTDVTSGRVVAERTDEVTLPMEKFQTAVLMLD